MSTDIALVANPLIGRQEGVVSAATANNGSTPPVSATRGDPSVEPLNAVNVPDKTAPASDRQALAAQEQGLPAKAQPEDEQTLQKAISDISSYVQNLQRDLQFQVDTDLGRTVISVVDSKTKEVIRQIPSEEVLARARFLEAQAADSDASDGLLLQVKT